MSLFDKLLTIHLVCDWLLQNEWMALNKTDLRHPSAWVHSGIHLCGLLLVLPKWLAVLVAITHILIDTRKPLIAWRNLIKQTTSPSDPATIHLAFWGDQVTHIAILALVALWLDRSNDE